ncbi:D-glycero-alpha-D-manno-heptose 7-phosphate kinase [Paraliobacillus sp. PM-2]|uniref:mevalonate kinase n=1 Tax=Paraliobacillus sp. PM-2 TaxID=1462524 RepID=UPI00061BEA21|nr:mevalonate kinase [Paraliobacillus sp. PM-2]CQR48432.1 D-glycero-alpha-D-manno-heptose 7-phosphate kinase [Paraliobacillus sp. PM-2]
MLELPQKTAIGSAHSKLILVGEHAVVYGEPAIALPFPSIHVKSVVTPHKGPVLLESSFYVGPLNSIPEKLKGIAACIEQTCKKLNKQANHFRMHIKSTIPIGRGLGSSAAIAIAVVRSLYHFFDQPLEKNDLLELVHLAETYAHGSPSGIDMEAVSSDVPIWFEKDKAIEQVDIKHAFHLVVADTGRIGDTHAAVSSIKEKYKSITDQTRQSIKSLGHLTKEAKKALQEGNHSILGEILNRAQKELVSLGVSDAGIDHLVKIAHQAGALGAKLTGGGRGGCIIALAKHAAHAKSLAERFLHAGADQTWHFQIGHDEEQYTTSVSGT